MYVLVGLEGSVGGYEHVDAQVELLAAHQQRVVHVTGDDVGLAHRGTRRALLTPAALRAPLLYLCQLVDQEDPLALRTRSGLHDPHGIGIAPELLHEQSVVRWKKVRHRHEVGINLAAVRCVLRQVLE